MELWEEKNGEAALLAVNLECGFDSGKVRLIEREATAATIDSILGTLEVFALCIEACLLKEPSLHEDHGHTTKGPSDRPAKEKQDQ